MKTIAYNTNRFPWDHTMIPSYLVKAIYELGEFPSIINGIKYYIYYDFCITFYILPSIDNIFFRKFKYLPEHIMNLLTLFNNTYSNAWITLFEHFPYMANPIILDSSLWGSDFIKFITFIKGQIYYSPEHPLSIMSNDTTHIIDKFYLFKSYFQTHPIYLIN